jgi:transcription antitermination factor NusG
MDVRTVSVVVPHAPLSLGADRRWYAIYTRSRHEKRVAAELQSRHLESCLPLYQAVHQWKDRRASVSLPLFPGYVFVRFDTSERLRVLQVPSVVRIVGSRGHAIPLQEHEIDALLAASRGGACAEPHPYLSVGRRVRIRRGPFQGLEGFVKRKSLNFRVVISLDSIMRSMVLNVDETDIEPVR